MESISDNALMQKVKTGDLDKLGLLYERYNRTLLAYFYRNTGDRSVSEDLVHTVFVRLLKYRDKFRNEGKFTTWMYHIAHNVVVDYWKKNRYRKAEEQLDEQMPADFNTDETVLNNEQLHLLNKALDRLSPDQREIIVLSRYQELKYREIGEIMGCSEGAVKVRVFRAMNELRKIYHTLEK